jgi:predicted dehydrogenase
LRRLGFARVAENAEAAILDPTVDAVVVATRHGLHADLVRQALAAGKHVFCEKPVALTLEDLEAVLAAAAGSEGILAVGFNRRFSPALARLRDFVGDSKRLVAHYRVSAGHLPDDHWLHDLEQGGGRILGEAGHFVDSLVSVTGSFVETVYAAGYGDPRLPVQASDNVALALRFRSGAVAQVSYAADGSDRLPKERLEVFAGSRTAILDDFRTLALYAPNRRRTLRVHQGKGHTEEIKAFIDGVRLGKPPVPIREIGNVTVATFCVIESLRTGLPVRIGSHEESDPER